MDLKQDNVKNLDACIKCSACTALCPVAAVNPLFPGPKSVGPDAERFRLEGIEMDIKCLNYCSNCKTCEVTCPSGVRITSMILGARERAKQSKHSDGKTLQHRFRDLVLGRAEYLGRLGTIWPSMTNTVLSISLMRVLMEQILGLSRHAPLPSYHTKFKPQGSFVQSDKQVVYFPGCFAKYNDAQTAQAVVKVLEHNGYQVIVPNFHCCGVPLQANGYFSRGRENAKKNLALMEPYLKAGLPVITSCTSCGLALKEEYPELAAAGAEYIGQQTYDLFEFLWELHERGELREDFQSVPVSLGYHAPCHLKTQGIGTPSVRLLRLIPGVQIQDLDAGCCGLSGSYGFKEEKYDIAMQIGKPLYQSVQQGVAEGRFQTMTTECGGCQVQIQHGSGVKTEHPVWYLIRAYDL
ncbi:MULTISPECIES: anaerobic glycerol-3-phosphate dehydrogenase subunit C [Desulfosporosinus]|uniref:Anaerobic glycerol-3-phosphate dehydrogenase subunit C n=1 Tax=Desulfosporosinus acididurans TaxID=476652 RepID=A0A0J1IQN8_9FIRM|nr:MULTISPECIES: anaerobic glycerol-3-phosphate dehydrogenase subunit C [Desulfosporosinus]KLU66991.1 anaerobic glycerol-3-phosphate dehydrogenase subunit C [Desulfosporosinus acididurans]